MPSSAGFGFDLMALLQNAFAGQFSPRREDGLAKLAVGQTSRSGNPMYGPSIAGLSGPDLVRAWARMDRQPTPDEMYAGHPGSPFAQWYQAIGAAPGMGLGTFARNANYQSALGQAHRGGGTQWWNPNPSRNSLFRGLGGLFG